MKDTFIRIKKNEYHLPDFLSSSARNLIQRLLQLEPERRPKVEAILEHEFITCGPLPRSLPTSCLAEEPRFDALMSTPTIKGCSALSGQKEGRVAAQGGMQMVLATSHQEKGTQRNVYLKELQCLVGCVCNARPPELPLEHPGVAEDPASVPVFWVSKWIDYTEKYGFGYQLCDNSIGVLFNDNTSIVLLNNNLNVTYVDQNGIEHYHSMEKYPPLMEKKMALLKYFCSYMKKYLLRTGDCVSPSACDNLVRLPCLGTWLRTRSAICFYLTNGTVQVNFFLDHAKIILCPVMCAVSHIENGVLHTYRIETLQSGCPHELLSRLKYARIIFDRLTRTS